MTKPAQVQSKLFSRETPLLPPGVVEILPPALLFNFNDIMNRNIKAIVFDMDGVIIDSMEYHAVSFAETLGDMGVDIDSRRVYELEGMGSELVIKKLLEDKDVDIEKATLDRLVKKKRRMFDEINKAKPFPGIKEIVEILRDGFKLGLVTGSNRENVEEFIRKYFTDTFDAVVTEEDTEGKKPEPDPYLDCLERLDLGYDECLVIENAPLGIESAKKAGIECWAIASYLDKKVLEEAGADMIFNDHGELKDFIEKNLIGYN